MTTDELAKAFAATREVLGNVKPDQYGDATPCASWAVRDLVNHIVEGANWFPLCVNAGAAPDPDPTHGVDYAAGDALAAFDRGAAAAVEAFGAEGAQERIIQLPFGSLPGAVFLSIATNDVVVHGWDLARATGQSLNIDDGVAAALLADMRGMADGMRGPDGGGAFGAEVAVSADSPALDRLVGLLGRQP